MSETLRTAVKAFLDASSEPAYSWVIESQQARAERRPNREVERMDRIARARVSLREALAEAEAATPSLDVERLARALEAAAVGCQEVCQHAHDAQAIAKAYAEESA